jgi:hypothetical protein
MGLLYARPKDGPAEYQKASGAFERIIKDYPNSRFRQDSELLIALIQDISGKEQKMKGFQNRTVILEKKVDLLETQIEKMKEIDLNIEAKKRRRAL